MKVSAPFEDTWDKLVRNLSEDFFSINNIEKASRIINVSFSTQNPGQFVDCGATQRSYTSPSGTKQSYFYNSEDSTQYKTAAPNGMPVFVNRKTNLEGRINIYVAPSGNQTDVSVNARFVLKINLSFQGMNQYEIPVGSPLIETLIVDFNTNNPSKSDGNSPGCASNGALEKRILDAAI